ncbi:MAG: hypothetical protein JXR96_31095 [Deltaproteobacteria bacterium]|nr:hypothetical protein [Deltaproteobacteria bacterium]
MRCFLGAWIGLACLWAGGCTFSSSACGNGEIESGEECDGEELGEASCESLGFVGGTLSCDERCKLDSSDCMSGQDEDVLRRCVIQDLCGYEPMGMGVGHCVERVSLMSGLENRSTAALAWEPVEACVDAAETCEALRACYTPDAQRAALCEGHEGSSICDGSWLIICWSEIWAVDCALTGLQCFQGETGASCGLEACDPSMEPYCDGDLLYECSSSGVLQAEDCLPAWGATCSEEGGEPVCTGPGEACELEDSHCEGSVWVACASGHLGPIDCSVLHPEFTCRVESGDAFCRPERRECETMMEGCEDGVITYCHLGRVAELDCARFGASGCEIREIVGREVGRCVP